MKLLSALDRIGLAGSFIMALLAPCCFPIFAVVGLVVGLGALTPYEGAIVYAFQGFALLTLAGLAISFFRHWDAWPLIIGTLGCASLIYHFYWAFALPALYAGLVALLVATVWNFLRSRRANAGAELQSVITCPHCGHRSKETMPITACLFFYDCASCRTRLKPKAGDCCVFCSYGSVACPPIQMGKCCA